MELRLFNGDRFVGADGLDVTALLYYKGEKAAVAWPVTVMHAPTHRYLDTEIIEQDGPEHIDFVAQDYAALVRHQFKKL